ncbi:acyltransferase [Pseudodesulfovibrio cashew]|nr:DapH/DapD/GlmU-related protein [Pseudodesulfovibrio cashew]
MRIDSVLRMPLELLKVFLFALPGRLGVFLRRQCCSPFLAAGDRFDMESGVAILGMKNLSLGRNVVIESRCTLLCPNAPLALGENCYLNKNVRLGSNGTAELRIGANVMIGPNVVMDTSRHNDARADIPMREQGMTYAPITIEDDVWIGANVVITSGVNIGHGSIIGAGAVVVRDIPPFSVAVGVPCRVVRKRLDGE